MIHLERKSLAAVITLATSLVFITPVLAVDPIYPPDYTFDEGGQQSQIVTVPGPWFTFTPTTKARGDKYFLSSTRTYTYERLCRTGFSFYPSAAPFEYTGPLTTTIYTDPQQYSISPGTDISSSLTTVESDDTIALGHKANIYPSPERYYDNLATGERTTEYDVIRRTADVRIKPSYFAFPDFGTMLYGLSYTLVDTNVSTDHVGICRKFDVNGGSSSSSFSSSFTYSSSSSSSFSSSIPPINS